MCCVLALLSGILTMDHNCDVLVLLVLSCVLQNVHASWWYLGIASSYQPLDDVEPIPIEHRCTGNFLEPRQQELCRLDKRLLDVIIDGASTGIAECQHQFATRRWNCSTYNTTNVFGKVLNIKSRETAYIYSIFSAGVMHSVIRGCAKGNLDHCGCDVKVRRHDTHGAFEWGGCSHDVRYGTKFTREFVDTNELKYSAAGLMNLWNNEAGRRTIKADMKLVCKCHGVSGSCSVKICWRRVQDFRQIGGVLKSKFDGASRVRMNKRKNRLKAFNRQQKKPTKKDLVYLDESPDFCELDSIAGSLGTHGRQCNKTSYGLDGCVLMCCGRGYYTIVKEIKEDCDCKFFWCCRVECKKCSQIVELNYCN